MRFLPEWTAVRGQVRSWGGACPAVGNRRREWRQRQGLLLEVFDGEGHRGVGEASPLPGFSPDTLEQCSQSLSAWCQSLPQTVNMAYFTRPPLVMPEPPAARFAVEMALLDLQAKREGEAPVPVTRLLGQQLPIPVFVSRLLDGRRGGVLVEQVQRGLAAGFQTFKLKVGGAGCFQDDLRLVGQLREAVPGKWRLRLDPNASWSLEQAPRYLEQLTPWDIELVEDPVPLRELPYLPPGPIPVAADEALKEEEVRRQLLPSRSCRLWILKPTLLGGFQRCLELASQAEERGIGCLVSHCFEGPVGLAAVRALAMVLESKKHPDRPVCPPSPLPELRGTCEREDVYAHGVDLHPALTAFPPLPVPGGGGARLTPWDLGGLGVEP